MRVHNSQAYRKMDVTREDISLALELREILLSFIKSQFAPHVTLILRSARRKMKLNEQNRHIFWQQAKHAKLYSDLP